MADQTWNAVLCPAQYVDYVGSWGPAIVGHAHPEVTEALTEQIKKVRHCAQHKDNMPAALAGASSCISGADGRIPSAAAATCSCGSVLRLWTVIATRDGSACTGYIVWRTM